MSRIDYVTITLVGICLCVLVYVLIKVSNLNDQKPSGIDIDNSPDVQVFQPIDSNKVALGDSLESKPEPPMDTSPTPQVETGKTPKNEDLKKLDFLVVAASFNNRPDAEKEQKRLQALGYSDAEIGLFNGGAVVSVIIGRFASYSEAEKQADALQKERNIKAYIHQKRR